MMTVVRRLKKWGKPTGFALLMAAWLMTPSCSGEDEQAQDAGSDVSSGGTATSTDGGEHDVEIDGAAASAGASSVPSMNPLCGEGMCLPDDALSCEDFEPPAAGTAGADGAGGDSNQGGVSGTAAEDDSGGADGESGGGGFGAGAGGQSESEAGAAGTSGAAGQAGQAEQGGASGASGAGGAAGSDPSEQTGGSPAAGTNDGTQEPPPAYGCRVEHEDDEARTACGIVGQGGMDAPCVTPGDCQAGFACVGPSTAGRCRPYCCSTAEGACPSGTYCAARPLRVDGVKVGQENLVPVCVQADNCSLAEPFPCPEQQDCTCSATTACTVVRAGGTTSCVEPGTGRSDEPCPCAWGYVCVASERVCKKLCSTTATSECGSGRCQDASNLPEGWGLCVASGSQEMER